MLVAMRPTSWIQAAFCAALAAGPALRPAAASDFVRGDCNADGSTGEGRRCDISDPIFLLGHLFLGSEAPSCLEACDVNMDGAFDVSDAVYQLLYCFAGGPEPPAPFPACGPGAGPPLGCESFPPCAGASCAAQDARGVGPCDAIVGVFWDGFRCAYHSGCTCEGEDCGEGYGSLEECYLAHGGCPGACDSMDARGVGECKKLLGFAWDGRRCLTLGGCECEGADCGRLYPSADACQAAVAGCPISCEPMDAAGTGACLVVIGWAWDGAACRALSGCDCEGADCAGLYPSEEECAAAQGHCAR
ncbi:MAG: hypothetical protein HY721_27960 [Planctomycetes bacterium]|nr:hypothetical protein [Planctomycetota bacterium]